MRSSLDLAYSATKGVDLQDSRTMNNISAALRDSCNLYAGGAPAACDKTYTNPFGGGAAFAGTSLNTSTSLSKATLSVPFPQFGQIAGTHAE
jgi:hypothetical protein